MVTNSVFLLVFSQLKTLVIFLSQQNYFKSMSEISKLKSIEITKEDVTNKLGKLKVGKRPGPDEIHPKFLYEEGMN